MEIRVKFPYYTAWEKYGWKQGDAGFPVPLERLRKAQARGVEIVINCGYFRFAIAPKQALALAQKYRSYIGEAGNECIIPRSACRKIGYAKFLWR